MKDWGDEKLEPVPDGVCSAKHGGFKKKSGKNNLPSNDNDYFSGLNFWIGKDGPRLYKKAIDQLTLYFSTKQLTD